MSKTNGASGADSGKRDQPRGPKHRRPLARWQKLLLAASAAIAVLGLALMLAGWMTGGDSSPAAQPAAPESTTTHDPALPPPAGFLPGDPQFPAADPTPDRPAAAQTSTDSHALETWSPAIFRAGFGFFTGFSIAYAMRAFVKISLTVIGLMLLALFGLQYANIIDVNWTAMEQHYDTTAAWLSSQTASFMRFVTGYIPSTAAALAGLTIGFRRA